MINQGSDLAILRAVSEKGQVTIPIEVRRRLGLRPGDHVRFELADDGVRLSKAAGSLEDAYGAVPPLARPEDFASRLRAAKDERAARRSRRS
jgi:AbrB family looped-hinge helix DNA binding protein